MEGNIGKVDRALAMRQWEDLKKVFEQLGLETCLIRPIHGLEDMIFTANQSFPFLDRQGNKKVILSKMFATSREYEVPYFSDWFSSYGYEVIDCLDQEDDFFEGMGDALWHQKKRLLLGSYGYRSVLKSLEKVSVAAEASVVAFKLMDPRFYHLDTCLSVLDEDTALIYPEAFDEHGLALIKCLFPRLIRVNEREAAEKFACNGFCPDKKHVIIQQGAVETKSMLETNGFIPIEVDTSEFIKSGGSVFCMKMALW